MIKICILFLKLAKKALWQLTSKAEVRRQFWLTFLGRLPPEEAQYYGAQLALIIEIYQYSNVMHRDLKPDNIMIADNDYLKVVRNSYRNN